MKGINSKTRVYGFLVVLCACLTSFGCYIHSDSREELAKDIQTRYGAILPGGLQILESLDADTERLMASKRAKFELLKETSSTEIVDKTWSSLIVSANTYHGNMTTKSMEIANQKKKTEAASVALQKRIDDLDAGLGEMDKAIAKIQNDPTLKERLDRTEAIIRQVTQTFTTLVPASGSPASSPIDERLSQAMGDINNYLGSLKSRDKTEQTYSLILEALRMGRDVASLEQEALQQEYNFHERSLAIYHAEERLVAQRDWLPKVIFVFGQYPNSVTVRTTIATLARDAGSGNLPSATQLRSGVFLSGIRTTEQRRLNAEMALRNLLEQLGQLQTIEITNNGRLNELDLKLKIEEYRNARLLDTIYERQRMSLISYGLKGVVRYSQGGFRTQDIARMIGIAQTIAQIVIGVRVGN